jgi:hypothetical protein
MIKTFENWLVRIVAGVVREGNKNAEFAIADLRRETTVSFQAMSSMQAEVLRLLVSIEQSQPQCCVEKQRLLVEMTNKSAALMDTVQRLHPITKV